MVKSKNSFWIALLDYCQDHEELRVRLWNGYIGWKLPKKFRGQEPQSGCSQFVVKAPPDGWPELTEEEMLLLDQIAKKYGGHPSWNKRVYMDFSHQTFEYQTKFSDLTLVAVDFSNSHFQANVKFDGTSFIMQSNFRGAVFSHGVTFFDALFEANVDFQQTQFMEYAFFTRVQFNGGASFSESKFVGPVDFAESEFSEKFFSSGTKPIVLAGFNGVEFQDYVCFHNVIFGKYPSQIDESKRSSRLADFSDARFHATTDFSHAAFNGAPIFYNCDLHEDTDFSRVKWPKVIPTGSKQIDDAIRAWERLELMMSKLEKPLDRHQFYRLKMRTRRSKDSNFLRLFNWLFDVTCDYGWSISRATVSWILHWLVATVLLFLNSDQAIFGDGVLKFFVAALGTAFANAHAFLGLASEGGYLESCRLLIEQNDQFGLYAVVGVAQAVVGPIFLFLLLLTLRNRFRLV